MIPLRWRLKLLVIGCMLSVDLIFGSKILALDDREPQAQAALESIEYWIARLMNAAQFSSGHQWMAIAEPSSKQAEQGDQSDKADQAIKNGSHPVWYDASEKKLKFPTADSLQATEDALIDRHRNVYEDAPSSNSAWSDWWTWLSAVFPYVGVAAKWILWLLIAALIVATVVYLWIAVDRGWHAPWRRGRQPADEDMERDRAKIVDLPFTIDTPMTGLLGQAEAFRRAGDYSKAVVYFYCHTLVELDEADCIRLQRGKTNRIYSRELKAEPRLAELHQYLMQIFEAVFFGRYSVTREQCDRCWSLLPLIENELNQAKQRRINSEELAVTNPNPTPIQSSLKNGLVCLSWIAILGFVGCNPNSQLPTDSYGGSNSFSRRSVGGLTVFRDLCQENGMRSYEVRSLSDRSYKLTTILWAPKDFHVPTRSEMNWFDDWLSEGTPRILIFIGRDYSPMADYWQQAAAAATPEDRRTFRLRQAYAEMELESARSRSDTTLDCDWFQQKLDQAVSRRIKKFRGPWAQNVNVDETNIVLRGTLNPNRHARKVKLDSELTLSEDRPTGTKTSKPDHDGEVEDLEIDYGSPSIETLLASQDGTPIISSITYDAWGESRLILIANGSLLVNESLANRGNQRLAELLIAEIGSDNRIGFLSTVGETRVRLPWDEQEPKGFELLRVWPLSLIAIQGLFIGSIALLVMLPIFGRPQKLPSPSTTDFGKHIEALGDLLSRSRDRNYALHRISDYFREVRRDTASPWSMVAPPDRDSTGIQTEVSLLPAQTISVATEPTDVTKSPPNSLNQTS